MGDARCKYWLIGYKILVYWLNYWLIVYKILVYWLLNNGLMAIKDWFIGYKVMATGLAIKIGLLAIK